MDKLEIYLDQVCRTIGGSRSLRQHLRQELREHIRDAAAHYESTGISPDLALSRALDDFGGPEEVRSELEKAHGHRLLSVAIDKAVEWKERTMKSKWLWTSWIHLTVVGIVVVNVLYYAFAEAFLVPKFRKLQRDGWLAVDESTAPSLDFLDACLRALDWLSNRATWIALGAAALWWIFEWRARSENKSLMRLAAFGTAGIVLSIGAVLISVAIILPFMLSVPALARLSNSYAAERITAIDAELKAIELDLRQGNWNLMQDRVDRAALALENLATNSLSIPAKSAQLKPMQDQLRKASAAIWEKNAARLEAAIQEFRTLIQPFQPAVRPIKN